MRPFLIKLVSVLLISLCLNVLAIEEKNAKEEARLIRKLFLDIKRVPPTPNELDWYLTYNPKPYNTAVDWIIGNTNTQLTKEFLLSENYKKAPLEYLSQPMLDYIIKYQSGSINTTIDQANKQLVKVSIAGGEDNVTDTIDYMSVCLTARSTDVKEINELTKIFKSRSSEEEGYLAVLDEIKTYKDYKTK
jgi:hypothetical protein